MNKTIKIIFNKKEWRVDDFSKNIYYKDKKLKKTIKIQSLLSEGALELEKLLIEKQSIDKLEMKYFDHLDLIYKITYHDLNLESIFEDINYSNPLLTMELEFETEEKEIILEKKLYKN